MLARIIKGQCFCGAFAFIIARSLADGVDVAPIRFRLRVLQGVTVHFRRGSQQETGPSALKRECIGGGGGVVGVSARLC